MAGAHFRRQHPIGSYVADFVCLEALLVIEVDGSQHSESDSDARRTEWLKAQGFEILRFWNQDVLRDTPKVCEMIFAALQKRMPDER